MTGKSRFFAPLALVLAIAVFMPVLAAAQGGGVRFSAVSWDFGLLRRGDLARFTLVVTNNAGVEATVSFIPTCDCLSAEPARLTLSDGAISELRLSYDSSKDLGTIRKDFIVSVEPVGPGKTLFTVSGTVGEAPSGRSVAAEGPQRPAADPQGGAALHAFDGKIAITYYYTAGCRSCESFLAAEIPRLERRLGLRLSVEKRDVLDPATYAALERYASSRGQTVNALPALVIGDVLLQGEEEIRGNLEATLLGSARVEPPEIRKKDAAAPGLAVIPVIVGGLLDGINPCAFTTLIFLLAALALAGRGRREVLVIGALFSLAVFLTYLSVGLGFFAALRAASEHAVVALVLRWLLVAVLAVFSALSAYDAILIARGRPAEILLQLPMPLKRRIHASIRSRVHTAAMAGSSLALGFLVSIFEFACTGQVYLPTLAYLVRLSRRPQALVLLVVYNLAFIAPLLAVFAASYLGVGSERVTRIFQRHMAGVKIGLAAFFLALAVFTLAG
jgi:cytochrome c biogenesis protein CcdA